jgi:hypothetical protein
MVMAPTRSGAEGRVAALRRLATFAIVGAGASLVLGIVASELTSVYQSLGLSFTAAALVLVGRAGSPRPSRSPRG